MLKCSWWWLELWSLTSVFDNNACHSCDGIDSLSSQCSSNLWGAQWSRGRVDWLLCRLWRTLLGNVALCAVCTTHCAKALFLLVCCGCSHGGVYIVCTSMCCCLGDVLFCSWFSKITVVSTGLFLFNVIFVCVLSSSLVNSSKATLREAVVYL